MPQDPNQLTVDEINALISDGTLTPEVATTKLTPAERAIYIKAVEDPREFRSFKDGMGPAEPARSATEAMTMLGVPVAAGVTGGALSAGGTGGIMEAAKDLIPAAKTGIGTYLGYKLADTMGLPAPVRDMILMLGGMKIMHGGKPMPSRTSTGGPIPEGVPSQYGDKRPPFTGVSKGRTLDPLQASEGGEIYDRVVNGGVTNDFRGRVTFRGQPPSLQRPSESDIRENVTGSSRLNWEDGRGTPFEYGPAADTSVEAIQKLIAEALDGGSASSTVTTPHRPLKLRGR